jgi:hypothetical protein
MSQPNDLGTDGLSGIATFGKLDAITRSDVVAGTWPSRGFPRNSSVGAGNGATSKIVDSMCLEVGEIERTDL